MGSPVGGGSPTCALKKSGLKNFNAKHVSNKAANLHNAKEKSCQRQAVSYLKNPARTNTVLFDEETAGFTAPYYVGHNNPNAERFWVDVNQDNGHLNYDWVYYEEKSGWWEK